MAAGVKAVTEAWNAWGIEALVLLSFTLQVALLILAEFRRCVDNGVLRAFVWSAYMLADSTAVYVLGHMSLTSRSPEHELMAFWAPFLLLHLGGQDNITAYAIEDNRLWLRHLQTLCVQVAACGYVLYTSSILGTGHRHHQSLLLPSATILMFAVGVLKYGERVWALSNAGSSPWAKNYRTFHNRSSLRLRIYEIAYDLVPFTRPRDTEAFLLIAHKLLAVPLEFFKKVEPQPVLELYYDPRGLSADELYKVIEMQLYLMYDIFYTKSEVMHTLYGISIRIFSMMSTAAAFILFQLQLLGSTSSQDGGYSRMDVAVTYVLLAGAVVLETASLLRAMLSSWTAVLVGVRLRIYTVLTGSRKRRRCWELLGRGVVALRRLVRVADWRKRYWSGYMGQHNLLQLCAGSMSSRTSRIARWMGYEDSWNTFVYSSGPAIPISALIKRMVVNQVFKSECIPEASPDHILHSRGRAALKSFGLYHDLAWSIDGDETLMEESILIWHIATDIYLYWRHEQQKQQDDDAQAEAEASTKAVEWLSNYMLFQLASRPHMLPSLASRNVYVEICYLLTDRRYRPHRSTQELVSTLWKYGNALNDGTARAQRYLFEAARNIIIADDDDDQPPESETLKRACKLGARLVSQELQHGTPAADMIKLVGQVWVEILCYVGHRCSAYSHAKQLSNGGDLVTIAGLLVEYLRRMPLPVYRYRWE